MTTTIRQKKSFSKPIHQFSEQSIGQTFMVYQGGMQEVSNDIIYMKINDDGAAISLNDGIDHTFDMNTECILVNINIEYEIVE